MQTIGEPLVSRKFLEGVAYISHSENIRFVELVSNGSLIRKRLPFLKNKCGVDLTKLSMWLTHHHTEITPKEFVDQALYAKDQGVKVIVNSLLFPDNEDSVLKLNQLCKKYEIDINIDLGHNYNDAYPGTDYFAVSQDDRSLLLGELNSNLDVKRAAIVASLKPKGFLCSAGHDYVFISSKGDVFPCRSYYAGDPNNVLGSALDEHFRLNLRQSEYSPCRVRDICSCKEDYLHMQIARTNQTDTKSLGVGYFGAVSDSERSKMESVLLQANETKLIKVLETT